MMQKRWRVVATGPWEQLEWQRPLEDAGCEVVLGKSFDQFPGEVYSEQDLIDLLRDADVALVSTRDRITRHVLESSPGLKLVVKATIGVEKIDLEAAAELGIVVVNSPAPENYIGVAEATVGLAIMLVKRLQTAQRLLTDGKWKQRGLMGTTLAGMTVGIIGLGRVGTNVARRFTAWDVRVVFYDPYVEPAGDIRSDAPQTDDADGHTRQSRAHEATLLPFAIREQPLRGLESLDQHDRQTHGGLRHADVVLRRGAVHNDDTQLGCCLEIYLLHPDGGLHDQLQPRRRLQHMSCDPVPRGDKGYVGIPQQVN